MFMDWARNGRMHHSIAPTECRKHISFNCSGVSYSTHICRIRQFHEFFSCDFVVVWFENAFRNVWSPFGNQIVHVFFFCFDSKCISMRYTLYYQHKLHRHERELNSIGICFQSLLFELKFGYLGSSISCISVQ